MGNALVDAVSDNLKIGVGGTPMGDDD